MPRRVLLERLEQLWSGGYNMCAGIELRVFLAATLGAARLLLCERWNDVQCGADAMKVVLPVWMDRISPVFDTARRVLVVEREDGREVGRREVDIAELSPARRVKELAACGATGLICGAISTAHRKMISAGGVEVIPFISGRVDQGLEADFRGRVSDGRFLMPGCGRQRRRLGSREDFGGDRHGRR